MDGGDEREFVGRRGIVRRGDVFIASMRGPSGKPRPTVVIHADEFIRSDGPVIVCPMTSELADAASIRVRIEPRRRMGCGSIPTLWSTGWRLPLRAISVTMSVDWSPPT
ncbi:type II toxin-antitoxin system PemK/MazF family toxin [Aurantimonas coralicida]|uniref:type II toxin-antitoxin system PemK/MazF family toxin n=1 Tax=Aurantimonas coralicida TaxID=182270 RepID=UPI0009DC41BA|nr:type II toxin-antitoxin system PemK/MazF family toxin [Aurantimonas coralicida]